MVEQPLQIYFKKTIKGGLYNNLNFLLMKKIFSFKVIIYFFSTLMILNCSEKEVDTKKTPNNDYQKEAKLVVDSYDLIKNDFAQNFAKSTFEIDQHLIDEYLEIIGMEAGSVSSDAVSQILNEIGIATKKDIKFVINQTIYSPLTKSKLIEISKGDVIENLNSIPGFESLSITERDILTFSNEIVREYNYSINSQTSYDVPCPSSACGAGLAIAGAIAGNAICGPACGVAGAIIGLIAGTAGK